jgi:hypothetical protein
MLAKQAVYYLNHTASPFLQEWITGVSHQHPAVIFWIRLFSVLSTICNKDCSSLNGFGTLLKSEKIYIYMTIDRWVYYWSLNSVPFIYMSVLNDNSTLS